MEQISTDDIVISVQGEEVSLWPSRLFPEKGKEEALDIIEHHAFSIFLAAGFFLPVTLVWAGIIPFGFRFQTMALVLGAMAAFCVIRRHSPADLGFRGKHLGKSLAWNGLLCLMGAMALYLLHKAGCERPRHPLLGIKAYLAYIFVLAPVQEIFFRGLFFAELDQTKMAERKGLVLILTSAVFAFLHVIYLYPPMIPVTFVAGMAWGFEYQKHRNIWGVILSHAVLGSLAMAYRII